MGGDRELVVVDGYGSSPHLHPVTQVRGYCVYLTEFTRWLHDQTHAVVGAASLHNAVSGAAVADLRDHPQDAYGRLFTGARRGDWLAFLAEHLVWRSGRWVTRRELNRDPDVRNRARGMVGTVTTSVDAETQQLLAGWSGSRPLRATGSIVTRRLVVHVDPPARTCAEPPGADTRHSHSPSRARVIATNSSRRSRCTRSGSPSSRTYVSTRGR